MFLHKVISKVPYVTCVHDMGITKCLHEKNYLKIARKHSVQMFKMKSFMYTFLNYIF